MRAGRWRHAWRHSLWIPTSEEAITALRAQVGDAMRALEAVGDARLEPVRSIAESLSGVSDEGERRQRIAARTRKAVPSLMDASADPDSTSGALESSRAASAAAWVRALGRDSGEQAAALERVASTAAPSVAAVLLTCAAHRYTAAARREDARRVAELATRTDAMNPRCIASLADALMSETTRPAAAALERAIVLVGPRAGWCESLARMLEALGEAALSVGWGQRLVALRPGDRIRHRAPHRAASRRG